MTTFSISGASCFMGVGGVETAWKMARAAAQADTCGRLLAGEYLRQGIESKVDLFLQLFAVEEGAVVLRVGEGFLEGKGVAAPVVNGVAVNAGFGGGCREGRAG